jgi:hypothetical protein
MDPKAEEFVATTAEPLHISKFSARECCFGDSSGLVEAELLGREEGLEICC